MNDIIIVMVTVDRYPHENYLRGTLLNLYRSGVFNSERLHSFHLVDSGMKMEDDIPDKLENSIHYYCSDPPRNANENVSEAFSVASYEETKWVLFLEDDIDVCGKFLDGVGTWLDRNERPNRHVYLFGSVSHCEIDKDYTEIRIRDFFGTQAFAIRNTDSVSLSNYLIDHMYDKNDNGSCYDLLMHSWSEECWPDVKHFAVSYPSFVQHVGKNSVINPRKDVHVFPTWPGRDWIYVSH